MENIAPNLSTLALNSARPEPFDCAGGKLIEGLVSAGSSRTDSVKVWAGLIAIILGTK